MICPNCRVDKEATLKSITSVLKERDDLRDRVKQLEAELATSRELKQIWQDRAYKAEGVMR